MKLNGKYQSGYLFNVAIPLFFFEWFYVILAFIFVMFIESIVINLFLNQGFKMTIKLVFLVNIVTTILGYFVQGITRLIILMLLFYGIIIINPEFDFYVNPFIVGVLSGVTPEKGSGSFVFTTEIIISIITSIVFAFTISVIVERKLLIAMMNSEKNKKLISKAIIIGNIVSYLFLSAWIVFWFSRMSF